MKESFYIKFYRILCTALCLSLLAGALCPWISASAVQDYSVTVDHPSSTSATGMPAILKNIKHGTDPVLTLAGWIKTEQKMEAYAYTLDGGRTWQRSTKAIVQRDDLKSICPNTYKTAGFHLNIDVSGLKRGNYDIFLRGYTDQGNVLEVLAMLDVSIGDTDTETMAYRELNLSAFGAQNGILTLQANTELSLDAYNLRDYQYAEFILDKNTVLTLHSERSSVLPFQANSSAPVQNQDGSYTAIVDLNDAQYMGKLLLSCAEQTAISRIRFYSTVPDYYRGELTVHMTATPYEYLSGANAVDASLMSDDTVGTYMRLYPTADTNDPYIYFNLNKYLKDTQDAQITADHYRYAVMTLQTPRTNSEGHFRLFLCAGDIHGPHGESHVAFQPTNDGKWHTYVIPLCKEEHWTGTVYGMRFDFIDGHANTSDYANIASIGFYPDEESAKQAAAQPLEIYHEQGIAPQDPYAEEGRAPSGKADAITWFDQSLADCFGGENQSSYSFDEYGHLILQATETTNDPFVSFSLQQYAATTGLPMLRAEDYGVIVLRIQSDKKIQGKGFVLYYYSGGLDFAQGTRAVGANYEGGEWEYLVYEMAGREAWTDEILGMRLDFSSQINAGQRVCLADMLFFQDVGAWEAYAAENGIDSDKGPVTVEPESLPSETEISTIEIPTQGPGLEYIPPQQFEQNENASGCKSILTIPLCALLPWTFVVFIKNKIKKGDQS